MRAQSGDARAHGRPARERIAGARLSLELFGLSCPLGPFSPKTLAFPGSGFTANAYPTVVPAEEWCGLQLVFLRWACGVGLGIVGRRSPMATVGLDGFSGHRPRQRRQETDSRSVDSGCSLVPRFWQTDWHDHLDRAAN